MSTFPLALTFLTVCPWPRRDPASPQDLADSMFWFPWVGAALGLGYWAAWAGCNYLLPGAAAAAVLLTLTVWATGALHQDGLADTADGLAGGRTPQDRLRIMKDSRLGTFGVATLVLTLLLKFTFFLAWAEKDARAVLILYPMVSRWGMVLLAFLSPYARPEGGLGQAMAQGVSPRVVAGATLSALTLAVLASGFRGLISLGAAGVAVGLLSRYFQKKLGGVTGDALGAANEVLEVLVLGGAWLLQPLGGGIFCL
jgi:adenosylcobinamide-GDP ribazoletransferase